MKKLILKTMAVCVALSFIAGQTPIAAGNVTSQTMSGQITSIYSYDQNFGLSGTYHSVTNNANGSISNIYSNGSVSGHGRLNAGQIDNSIFIPQSISYFNASGVVQKTQDLVTNTFQVFDFTGQLQTSYTMIAKQAFTGATTTDWANFLALPANWYYYYATIARPVPPDGSYKVQRSGEMYDSATSAYVTIHDYALKNSLTDADAIAALQAKWPNLANLAADSPYPFITSEEQYDSTGKLLKVVTYSLKADNSASVAAGEVDYSYTGTSVSKTITYQYDVDASGNPIAPTTFDANGLPTNNVTVTQAEIYTGGNRTTVIKIKPGTAADVTDYSDYMSASSNYYLAQQYKYSGAKLTEMDAYDSTDQHNCNQITYFDLFGRETSVVDPVTDKANKSGVARAVQEFFYNDELNPTTFNSFDGQNSATVVSGGLKYSVTYTYAETGADYISADQTFYKNGDQTKPSFAIHQDNPTAIAELTAPAAPGNMTLGFADNIVQGTLTLGGSSIYSTSVPVPDGSLSLAINDSTYFLAVLNALQLSIDEGTTNLSTILDTLKQQWVTSGGTGLAKTGANDVMGQATWKYTGAATAGITSIKLGVISLPAAPSSANSTVEYAGGAPVVNKANQVTGYNPAGVFDVTNFNTLFNWAKSLALTQSNGKYNNPIAANLTCNYWALDNAGNIWAFTDSVTDANSSQII